jgi:HlyD family secretion protein
MRSIDLYASHPVEDYPWRVTSAPRTPYPRLRTVARIGNMLILCFVVGFGAWSVLAPLESAAIAAGDVEAESSRKTIQHLEGGIIQQILVEDGRAVTAGQTLIKLDDTKPRAELQALAGQYWDAKARQARLTAERNGRDAIAFPPQIEAARGKNAWAATILSGQQKIFETRRQVHNTQITIIHERISQVDNEIVGLKAQETAAKSRASIIRQEVAAVTPLVEKGLERRVRLLNLEREMADIDGRRGEAGAQISRAYQVISEAQANLLKLESDRQNEIAQSLREAENQIYQLGERIRAVNDQLARTEIKAPEDGVITDLRVRTPGGVIAPGAPLMDLVPREDRLVIVARLRPEDRDVVHTGLKAEVHLLPYSQRRVPPLDATVTYVSPDRLLDKRTDMPYYAARLRVTDERLADMAGVQMVPGMPAHAMIKTGQSTVALYALRPLIDSFHRAFKED